MKKKLAILVGGMYREFVNAHTTWPFLKYDNSDVFFSTWDTTYEINRRIGIDLWENIGEKDILYYIPEAKIKLSKDFNDDKTTLSSINKILFHWKILLDMVKESKNDYEHIILTRPDMFFKENGNLYDFIKTTEDDTIYGLTPVERLEEYPHYYVQDCFFLSKFNVIFKMIESLDINSDYDDIHVMLSHYFIKNNINVLSLYPEIFEYFVLRSVHRNYMGLTFNELREIGLDWWHIKHRDRNPDILKQKLINEI